MVAKLISFIWNSRKIQSSLVVVIVSASVLVPSPSLSADLSKVGTIAYIAAEGGRDAIFIKGSKGSNTIFNCAYENEIILTPSVSRDGSYLSFVVDQGRNERMLHILGPITFSNGKWQAVDSILMMVKGGAWPIYGGENTTYLSMPNQTSLVTAPTSHIFQIQEDRLIQLSNNQGISNHIWPLLDPSGDRILYREIPGPEEDNQAPGRLQSVLQTIESGAQEYHFINQNVFLEQWVNSTEVLISTNVSGEPRMRSYGLYNLETRESQEIYRNSSRQGRLTSDSRYMATIRPVPPGGAQFDVFITDLESQDELNLTQSPKQSESLIGWIK